MPHQQLPPSQRFEFETLFLDHKADTALFRQLEGQLRESIWRGVLRPGERLPSTRVLAKQLNVGRNTVINAYEQLTAEGFLVTKKGDGTRVTQDFEKRKKPPITKLKSKPKKSENKNSELPWPLAEPQLSMRYKNHAALYRQSQVKYPSARPFRAQLPDVSAFPAKVWAQLTNRRLRSDTSGWLLQAPSQGYEPLREAIAGYLGAARGITTNHQHISVTAGAQQGIELLAKMLVNPGDVVVFEDPGYTPAMTVFEMMGATVISIPIDESGLDVKKLLSLKERVKIIYTTPASHFPLSVSLSQARRKTLIEWAQTNNCMIIEDDYNGEYRYSGRPAATLYEQCNSNHVIYMSSFSKLLFPGLRLGFLVTPEQFVAPLNKLRWLLDRHSPGLEQAVLTDFINEGHFSRHLRKMRTLYLQRQKYLLAAAAEHLNGIMVVPPLDGGLHLIGWLQEEINERDLLKVADTARVELTPTSLYQRLPVKRSGVLMGYAAYSEKQLLDGVLALKNAYNNIK